MTFRKARGALAAALVVASLLCGCNTGGAKPVSGPDGSVPPVSADPTGTPSATDAGPGLTAGPTPAPAKPPSWSFPMKASDLFAPGAPPEGFRNPLHLFSGGEFIYATADGKVFRARWAGAGFETSPVAEMLECGPGSWCYVDEERGLLFGQGCRFVSPGRVDPAVVMVDLKTAERCNVDELAGWKQEGIVFSREFQYCRGVLLARLQGFRGGLPDPLDKWALVDVAGKAFRVIDLSGFREKYLPQWRETEGLRLALAGEGRLLAVCRVKGLLSAGTAVAASGEREACAAILLNPDGTVLKSGEIRLAVGGGTAAVLAGCAFSASPDGRHLLYSGEGMRGLYVMDTVDFLEQPLSGGGALCAYAEWDGDAGVLYGMEAESGGVIVARAAVANPSPEQTGTP